MRGSAIQARRKVKMAIIAYCHELFLNCDVEKVYWWGEYLKYDCTEGREIVRIARKKLGYKNNYGDRDIFWNLQCTWRKMVENGTIILYRPEFIKRLNDGDIRKVKIIGGRPVYQIEEKTLEDVALNKAINEYRLQNEEK